ncbi:uncharacterized protein LOC111411832 [Olea europaea var. sylvestris]|uniref:uncharacterized protein LOC111411832 n=1 Tax=Olea europaea var. sylvestris TaxID=158386 RepID=UPI000C1CE527|nr:uncharacterized protein LOC111411832 [Olea europaea var. sylvestris]XP_022898229.1 uncharacterized protein LOC111411832 [Olea europaea var. sylvestris]
MLLSTLRPASCRLPPVTCRIRSQSKVLKVKMVKRPALPSLQTPVDMVVVAVFVEFGGDGLGHGVGVSGDAVRLYWWLGGAVPMVPLLVVMAMWCTFSCRC